MCVFNSLLTRLSRLNFEINLYNQAVFSTCPISQDKNLNILRTKKAFKVKERAFFIIFEGLSLKQIYKIFLEGETPTLKKLLEEKPIVDFPEATTEDLNKIIKSLNPN